MKRNQVEESYWDGTHSSARGLADRPRENRAAVNGLTLIQRVPFAGRQVLLTSGSNFEIVLGRRKFVSNVLRPFFGQPRIDLICAQRPWNAGKLVPAGSDMVFSLHDTANGKAAVDRTKIGFTVAKAPPPKKFVTQQAGEDTPVIEPSTAS